MIQILTDFRQQSRNALIPLFSKELLSICFYSVFVLAGLIVLTWPWQGLVTFLKEQRIPFTFPLLAIGILMIQTYLHTCLGRGEMAINPQFLRERIHQQVLPSEVAIPFFRYGLLMAILQIAVFLCPALPLMFIVAAVSGATCAFVAKTLSIIFLATLMCRLFAFVMYLFWGNTGILGYFFARVFLFVTIYLSAFLKPPINPIRLMYRVDVNEISRMFALTHFDLVFIGAALASISLLTVLCELLARRQRHKFAQQHL